MKDASRANRGKAFEELIIHTNEQYKNKHLALVDKVPTEWQIIRGAKGKIVHAFPVKKSSVDFIGLSNGLSFAFDAKSTMNKTSFPLSNIEKHQLDYLKEFTLQSGCSFFLIHFTVLKRTFFLSLEHLNQFMLQHKRKSIPYSYFVEACPTVKQSGIYLIDYLPFLVDYFVTS